jgi:hypothetical protein
MEDFDGHDSLFLPRAFYQGETNKTKMRGRKGNCRKYMKAKKML